MDIVRQRRNELLAASDWTQLGDVNSIDAVAWRAYRQQLRDTPAVIEIEFGKTLDDYFPSQP